jgi:hypothetical protein
MRVLSVTLLAVVGLGLSSCNRETRNPRSDEAARQAGREAYRASQDVKRGAKEAAKDLRNAGKEFREGWTEAQHRDEARRAREQESKRRDDH